MKVAIGQRELEMGGPYMTELRDSACLLGDVEALRARMAEDGYLLLRGFHDRSTVLRARSQVLARMQAAGRLAPGADPEEAAVGPERRGYSFMGHNRELPALLDVVNSGRTMRFFSGFLGGDALTFDYKWGRAVAPGEFTGAHYDIVYMGRGTRNLYTMWTPLCDIPYALGGLALCLGSQRFEKIRRTYGQMDVDRDHVVGWFSSDPVEIVDKFGGRWASAEFAAGDALIFGMFIMHGSLTNTTDRYRLSVDTRYQLASEPADERWMGRDPVGHYAWQKGQTVTMADARNRWGV